VACDLLLSMETRQQPQRSRGRNAQRQGVASGGSRAELPGGRFALAFRRGGVVAGSL